MDYSLQESHQGPTLEMFYIMLSRLLTDIKHMMRELGSPIFIIKFYMITLPRFNGERKWGEILTNQCPSLRLSL